MQLGICHLGAQKIESVKQVCLSRAALLPQCLDIQKFFHKQQKLFRSVAHYSPAAAVCPTLSPGIWLWPPQIVIPCAQRKHVQGSFL
jgi:hypothetical protein